MTCITNYYNNLRQSGYSQSSSIAFMTGGAVIYATSVVADVAGAYFVGKMGYNRGVQICVEEEHLKPTSENCHANGVIGCVLTGGALLIGGVCVLTWLGKMSAIYLVARTTPRNYTPVINGAKD